MTFITGFSIGFSLILAIGAQNAFVLKQGLIRQNVFLVCLICAASDAILITLGVSGFGEIITEYPIIERLARIGGALFLFTYGVLNLYSAQTKTHALEPTKKIQKSKRKTVLTCLGFTWLNPHVYLDTVVMLGSISTQFENTATFALGAISASFVFFFSLGFGASKLTRYFEKPRTWRVLENLIGILMIFLGITLVI
ncbi:MAG: LysE/ArgO family amino acid transporter [Pseudomonadales bacterium]|nr:LysE/ArgO family amino acid transporter [Pseudomonadales bacterium]